MMIEVVPYDADWVEQYERESEILSRALSPNILAIHHIGSTAVPGMSARPIVDLLAEVKEIDEVDMQVSAMEVLGYESLGENGIPGRRYFRKDDATGRRVFQVHAFETRSADVERHLAFRDYLRCHPEDARKYSKLKQQLANQFPDDLDGYWRGKYEFVQDLEQRAVEWRANSS